MTRFVTAGAGFLLAVLWFDLMFDVQVWRHRDADVPEDVLGSIARYYARVTTAARPMNRLIAAVMLATAISIGVQMARDDVPRWLSLTSIVLAGAPIGLAGSRTVPNAIRLGARRDSAEEQSRLATQILRDHLFCLTSISAVLVVQLAFG